MVRVHHRLPWLLWLALAATIAGCDRNDLSDINKLYQARLDAQAGDIAFTAQLTPAQVAASEIPQSDLQAEANLSFDYAGGSLSGEVEFASSQTASVQAVEIYRGRSGHAGHFVTNLIADSADPRRYVLTDDYSFDKDQLLDGGYYVLVRTDQHASGALRAQLLPPWKRLLVHTLTPGQVVDGPVMTQARARSYLVVDFADGSLQGSVRLTSDDIVPSAVGLYKGVAGQVQEEDNPIVAFIQDPQDSQLWNIDRAASQDGELSDKLLPLLAAADLYVQIPSKSYPQGALRTQVYLHDAIYDPNTDIFYPGCRILIVDMLGQTTDSGLSMDAAGKAFVTVKIDADNIYIRSIVRFRNVVPESVALIRSSNIDVPSTRQEVHRLKRMEDYWQPLPDTPSLDEASQKAYVNGIRSLYIVAQDPMAGELIGRL